MAQGNKTVWNLLKIAAAVAGVAAVFALWPKDAVEVGVVRLEKGEILDIISTSTSGTVKAARYAKIRSSTAGDVEKVLVKKGDRVRNGDLVVKLKNREHAARVELSRANLAAGEASRRQAELRTGQVRRSYDRTKKLYDQQVASETSMEQAATEKDVGAEVMVAADANIQQLRAALEIARISYDATFIRAPFDGVIASISIEEGEALGLGMQVFDIYDDGGIKVETGVDEVDAVRVRPGMQALLFTDALQGSSMEGRVGWISPLVTHDLKGSRNVDITIDIVKSSPALRVGMSLDTEIIVERRQGVNRLPTTAVMGKGAARHVLVAEKGMAVKRQVQTGIVNWELTEVVSGIAPDDQVIFTLNAPGLVPGAPVRVNPALTPQRVR